MPAITSGKVLVTGANGFVAVWLVKTLLERGFSVRGTIRSASKGTYVKELFKDYRDKLELVIVDDITKSGAFDEYVKDVDAIEHTASPFHFHADDPQEIIGPAVQGTTNILASALKYGTSVKRVVVTSSTAAISEDDPNPRTFNEKFWNHQSLREVETKGRNASATHKYRASKTFAERAAWDFYEKNKLSASFDLAVINPPFVFGPPLHEVNNPQKLNSSMADWWATVIEGKKDDNYLATAGNTWVDVRDLAKAHALALEKEDAGGQRLVVGRGVYKWQDWVNAAHAVDPNLPAGNTAYDPATAYHHVKYDASHANTILGIKYHDLLQTTRDIIDVFKAKNWL